MIAACAAALQSCRSEARADRKRGLVDVQKLLAAGQLDAEQTADARTASIQLIDDEAEAVRLAAVECLQSIVAAEQHTCATVAASCARLTVERAEDVRAALLQTINAAVSASHCTDCAASSALSRACLLGLADANPAAKILACATAVHCSGSGSSSMKDIVSAVNGLLKARLDVRLAALSALPSLVRANSASLALLTEAGDSSTAFMAAVVDEKAKVRAAAFQAAATILSNTDALTDADSVAALLAMALAVIGQVEPQSMRVTLYGQLVPSLVSEHVPALVILFLAWLKSWSLLTRTLSCHAVVALLSLTPTALVDQLDSISSVVERALADEESSVRTIAVTAARQLADIAGRTELLVATSQRVVASSDHDDARAVTLTLALINAAIDGQTILTNDEFDSMLDATMSALAVATGSNSKLDALAPQILLSLTILARQSVALASARPRLVSALIEAELRLGTAAHTEVAHLVASVASEAQLSAMLDTVAVTSDNDQPSSHSFAAADGVGWRVLTFLSYAPRTVATASPTVLPWLAAAGSDERANARALSIIGAAIASNAASTLSAESLRALLVAVLLPSMQWRAGAVHAALRMHALTCITALIEERADAIDGELVLTLLSVLHSQLDDDAAVARRKAAVSVNHLAPCLVAVRSTVERDWFLSLLTALSARLDDGDEAVRLASLQAWHSLLLAVRPTRAWLDPTDVRIADWTRVLSLHAHDPAQTQPVNEAIAQLTHQLQSLRHAD